MDRAVENDDEAMYVQQLEAIDVLVDQTENADEMSTDEDTSNSLDVLFLFMLNNNLVFTECIGQLDILQFASTCTSSTLMPAGASSSTSTDSLSSRESDTEESEFIDEGQSSISRGLHMTGVSMRGRRIYGKSRRARSMRRGSMRGQARVVEVAELEA